MLVFFSYFTLLTISTIILLYRILIILLYFATIHFFLHIFITHPRIVVSTHLSLFNIHSLNLLLILLNLLFITCHFILIFHYLHSNLSTLNSLLFILNFISHFQFPFQTDYYYYKFIHHFTLILLNLLHPSLYLLIFLSLTLLITLF